MPSPFGSSSLACPFARDAEELPVPFFQAEAWTERLPLPPHSILQTVGFRLKNYQFIPLISKKKDEYLPLQGQIYHNLKIGVRMHSEALEAIKNGEMVANMGGHFMEAGWALILLYDYHNGVDFKDDLGVEYVTKMQAITQSNVDECLNRLGNRNWNKIDFKQFSKVKDTQLKTTTFHLKQSSPA